MKGRLLVFAIVALLIGKLFEVVTIPIESPISPIVTYLPIIINDHIFPNPAPPRPTPPIWLLK